MNRLTLVPRVVVLAFLVVAALVVSSCESGGGMGAGGVGYPARWGGGGRQAAGLCRRAVLLA